MTARAPQPVQNDLTGCDFYENMDLKKIGEYQFSF